MKSNHKKILDRLWSLCVRWRDDFTCRRCHKKHDEKSKGLHAHHIMTKGSHGFSVRWKLSNGVSVCYGCHMFLQGNPQENERFAREVLEIDYDYLKFWGKKTVKVDYLEKREELEEKLNDIKREKNQGCV